MIIDRSRQPAIQNLSELKSIPIEHTILPNGIPLTIINAEEQDVVSIDFLFDGGLWVQEMNYQAGFTNIMLNEGTTKYSSAQLAERFDFYGSEIEKGTLPQYTYITAYSLNKYFEQTIELVSSMIKEPTFPESEFQTHINCSLDSFLIQNSKTSYLATKYLNNALFGDYHPLGKITQETDYKLLSTECLKSYHRHFYNSQNCHIILAGKVTEHIIELTEKMFGTEPFGAEQNKVLFKNYRAVPSEKKRIFIERADAKQSSIRMGMNTAIDIHHPDYLKFYILVTILGGYFGSRLMNNIREEKGYTYGISAVLRNTPDNTNLIISSDANDQYIEPLINEVYHEIDRLQTEKISIEELDIVRNYMTGNLCRSLEISFNAAYDYKILFINGLEEDFRQKELQAIQSVTPEELLSLAQQYLCKENLKEVISGKKKD